MLCWALATGRRADGGRRVSQPGSGSRRRRRGLFSWSRSQSVPWPAGREEQRQRRGQMLATTLGPRAQGRLRQAQRSSSVCYGAASEASEMREAMGSVRCSTGKTARRAARWLRRPWPRARRRRTATTTAAYCLARRACSTTQTTTPERAPSRHCRACLRRNDSSALGQASPEIVSGPGSRGAPAAAQPGPMTVRAQRDGMGSHCDAPASAPRTTADHLPLPVPAPGPCLSSPGLVAAWPPCLPRRAWLSTSTSAISRASIPCVCLACLLLLVRAHG